MKARMSFQAQGPIRQLKSGWCWTSRTGARLTALASDRCQACRICKFGWYDCVQSSSTSWAARIRGFSLVGLVSGLEVQMRARRLVGSLLVGVPKDWRRCVWCFHGIGDSKHDTQISGGLDAATWLVARWLGNDNEIERALLMSTV